jgi:hypothetical protein
MARRVDWSYVPSDARAPENGYTAKTYRKVCDLLQKESGGERVRLTKVPWHPNKYRLPLAFRSYFSYIVPCVPIESRA